MRTLIALAAALVLSCVSGPTRAHAQLDHAEPRVGSTVPAAPSELSLWFTQKLEPGFSRVEVRDARGARVDAGEAHVEPSDPVLLRVPLKPLQPGTYKVYWRILSVDTHRSEGHFSFRVEK